MMMNQTVRSTVGTKRNDQRISPFPREPGGLRTLQYYSVRSSYVERIGPAAAIANKQRCQLVATVRRATDSLASAQVLAARPCRPVFGSDIGPPTAAVLALARPLTFKERSRVK